MNSRIRAALLVGSLLACGDESSAQPNDQPPPAVEPTPAPVAADPPAPTPEQARAAAAESLLGDVEALAELHRRHADDCPALAAAITKFAAEHPKLAEAPAEIHAHVDADERARERMRTAMEAVMSAAMACRSDPAFAAAQAQIPEREKAARRDAPRRAN